MPYAWSPSTGGFYHTDLHPRADMPKDVVPISDAEHAELMRQQSMGRRIVAEGSRPVAVEARAPADLPAQAPAFPPLAFRRRFTEAERTRIALAANEAANGGDPTLINWMFDISAAPLVRTDAPEIVEGMQRLVELGLLSERRRASIMGS